MSQNSAETNKSIIRHLLAESDKGNLAVIEEVYSDKYVDHTPSPVRGLLPGRDGIKQATEIFLRAFPDTEHTIEHLIAEDDFVVAHISAKGTHEGELFGVAATGKKVTLSGIAIYRIQNGRIVERWAHHGLGVLQQLGIDLGAAAS